MTEILSTKYYKLIEARHGRFLVNPQDAYIGRAMIETGSYSEEELALLLKIAKPGAWIVDAGANIGCFTVPLALRVGMAGRVYAFEPQPLVFELLAANCALNDAVTAVPRPMALGAEEGVLELSPLNPAKPNNFGGIPLERLTGKSGYPVRLAPLDAVIDPPRLTLIKADLEGMEIAMLRGAAGLIRAHRPVLYVENGEVDRSPALIEAILGYDYDLWWHIPPMLEAGQTAAETHLSRVRSKNMLCFPAERGVDLASGRRVAGPDDHPKKWG